MSAPHCLLFLLLVPFSYLLAQSADWVNAGNRALYAGRPAEAATNYRRALESQVQAGAPRTVLLHLRVNLATAYLEAGDTRAAESVLPQVDEADGLKDEGATRAEVLNTRAAVHTLQGKWRDAEHELREAREIMLHEHQLGDILPTVLHNLASIELRTGNYAEARSLELEALSLWGKFLDPDHPHMIRAWSALGAVEYLVHRPQEAHQSMQRAIASARKTYGPEHPIIADLLQSDAVILDRLKLKKEAKLERTQERAIRCGLPSSRPSAETWNIREALAPDSAVRVRTQ